MQKPPQIQHLSTIRNKALRKIQIEGNFLSLIKNIVLVSQNHWNHKLSGLKPEIYCL